MKPIVAYGEIMMRLNPNEYKRLDQTSNLEMSFTGTGLNVLAGLARHNYSTRLLSILPDNRVGEVAKASIRHHNIQDTSIKPNGNHIGIYLIELGYEYRPSEVTYLNRSQSAFNTTVLSEEEIAEALNDAHLLHLCGIALSTSKTSLDNVLRLVEYASQKDIPICFDFNYRPSLNQDMDEQELLNSYKKVLEKSTIVVGSLRDVNRFTAETDLKEALDTFTNMFKIKKFIGTIKSENDQEKWMQGYVYADNKLTMSERYPIRVFDRIGTGDAFVSAYLSKYLRSTEDSESIDYAACAAHLAFTTSGDTPVLDEAFIEKYRKDKPDVIR